MFPLLVISPQELKTHVHSTVIYTCSYIYTLFTISKNEEQLMSISRQMGTQNVVVYTVKYDSAIKRIEALTRITSWMNFEHCIK